VNTGPAGTAPAGHDHRLAFADGIRGLAALWVVLFHASEGQHLEHLKAALPAPLVRFVFDWGDLGVPAFFVLSGFVMMVTVERLHFDGATAARFAVRRMIRLGPPYYAAIALALAMLGLEALLLGRPMVPFGSIELLTHATYTQAIFGVPHVNFAFWTLCIEVQFYLVFASLLWWADRQAGTVLGLDRRAAVLLGAWLVGLPWALGLITDPLYPGGFLPFWFSFMAGVLAFLAWQRGGQLKPLFWVYVLMLLWASASGQQSSFACTAALVAGALVLAGATGQMRRWLKGRTFAFLGACSYSLYLLHGPLSGAAFYVLRRLLPPTAIGEAIALAVVVGLCLAAAWLSLVTIERLSIGWSKRLRMTSAPAYQLASQTDRA